MANTVYDIASRANVSGFVEAENAIDRMTGAQVRWNATAKRWQSESGQFIAANRVVAGSIDGVTSKAGPALAAVRSLALGFVGSVGLAAAMTVAYAAGKKFEEWVADVGNTLRYGTANVKELRDAVRELAREGGKGKPFGIDPDELDAVFAELEKQTDDLSTTASAGMLGTGPSGFIGRLFFGDGDAKQSLEVVREAGRIVEEEMARIEARTRAIEEIQRAATSAGLALPFNLAFPGQEEPEAVKERTTLLEKERDKRAELAATVRDLAGAGASRVAALRRENEETEEYIGVLLRLADARNRGTLTIPGLEALTGEGVQAIDQAEAGMDRVEHIGSRYTAFIERTTREQDRALNAAVARHDQFAQQMNAIVGAGFADLLETTLSGGGSVGGAMADFLSAMGRATIGAAPIKILTDWRALSALGAPGMVAAGSAMIATAAILRRQFASAHSSTIGAVSGGGGGLFFTGGSTRGTGSYTGDVYNAGRFDGASSIDRLAAVVERLERDGLRGTLTSERGAFKAEVVSQKIRDEVNDVRFYHGGA